MTPDTVKPIRAIRSWNFKGEDLKATSMLGYTWPSPAIEATCRRAREYTATWNGMLPSEEVVYYDHPAPQYDCTCGIYACKTLADLKHVCRHMWPFKSESRLAVGRYVIGEVDLWGKVIEYGQGFRAQHARIVGLYETGAAVPIAQRYGVALLDVPEGLYDSCACSPCQRRRRESETFVRAPYRPTVWSQAIDITPARWIDTTPAQHRPFAEYIYRRGRR